MATDLSGIFLATPCMRSCAPGQGIFQVIRPSRRPWVVSKNNIQLTHKQSTAPQDTRTLLISLPKMSNFFYEPFFSLSEFDRLFDQAFDSRVGGGTQQGNQQVQRHQGGDSGSRLLRPR